jgi:hypothetical protein
VMNLIDWNFAFWLDLVFPTLLCLLNTKSLNSSLVFFQFLQFFRNFQPITSAKKVRN